MTENAFAYPVGRLRPWTGTRKCGAPTQLVCWDAERHSSLRRCDDSWKPQEGRHVVAPDVCSGTSQPVVQRRRIGISGANHAPRAAWIDEGNGAANAIDGALLERSYAALLLYP